MVRTTTARRTATTTITTTTLAASTQAYNAAMSRLGFTSYTDLAPAILTLHSQIQRLQHLHRRSKPLARLSKSVRSLKNDALQCARWQRSLKDLDAGLAVLQTKYRSRSRVGSQQGWTDAHHDDMLAELRQCEGMRDWNARYIGGMKRDVVLGLEKLGGEFEGVRVRLAGEGGEEGEGAEGGS